jgi:tellurite resistance protein
MEHHPTNPDARDLEEEFFARQNAALLEKLRAQARVQARRDALREVAPNADDALLDHLITLGLGPETVLALTLVPLAVVAWADGQIDGKERAALLKAAEERGVAPGSPARALLESWLDHRPPASLLETWKRYARGIWGTLDETHRAAMRERMLGLARGIAEATGGFLGLGSKVSPAERAVLEELERALST